MVKKFFKLFSTEYASIHKTALLLSVTTLFAQALGLVRDRLFAGMIGPGQVLDVYYASFKIPDLVFSILASLISVTILIPIITDISHNENSQSKLKDFLSLIYTWYLSMMVVFSILLIFTMPWLAKIVAPGFNPDALSVMVNQSRLLLLSPLLLGLSQLFGAINQSRKRFFAYACAPIVYNLGIIIGLILFYPTLGNNGLALGVVVGALFHLLIQLKSAYDVKTAPRFNIAFLSHFKQIGSLVRKSWARTVTLAITQIIFTVLIALASKLSAGSISLFQFAYILQSVPLALLGVSYSVASFPELVRLHKTGNYDLFMETFLVPVRSIIFWSLPMITLGIVFRAHIVRIIFGTNTFSWNDTKIVAAVFAVFIVSLVFQALNQVIIRAFYSIGETIKPLVRSIVDVVFTLGLSYFLISQHSIYKEAGQIFTYFFKIPYSRTSLIILLAFAFTIGQLINFVTLWWSFKKTFVHNYKFSLWDSVIQGFLGAGLGGFVAYGMLFHIGKYIPITSWFGIVCNVVIATIFAVFVMSVYWYFAKNREFLATFSALRSKFWKTEIEVGVEKEQLEI